MTADLALSLGFSAWIIILVVGFPLLALLVFAREFEKFGREQDEARGMGKPPRSGIIEGKNLNPK